MPARMTQTTVSREEWLVARRALLEQEKLFSRQRDALSAARRALPAVEVTHAYRFDSARGAMSLRDLFGPHRQLVVYHFMLDPTWEAGCKNCSLIADHFEPSLVHLAARDTALVAVSRAKLDTILAFEQRMGWSFPWVSSFGTDFNYDFGVSFRAGDPTQTYNYIPTDADGELPGASFFLRDGDRVLHTYSTYARGLDIFIGAYNYLDHTALGRQEGDDPMAWVRHHDRYGR